MHGKGQVLVSGPRCQGRQRRKENIEASTPGLGDHTVVSDFLK